MSTNTPDVSPTLPGYIHRDDFGDAWPFTVDDGVLECHPPDRVVFIHDGVTYAINGMARGAMMAGEGDYVDFRETIWRDNPDGSTPKVYVGDIIQMGLALCREARSGVQNLVVATNTAVPTIRVTVTPSSGGQVARPGNCATAVAMGLSDVEAGRWSHLDRDGDGVACYGD